MKIRLFIAFLACMLSSCADNEDGVSDQLTGQWAWKSTCGGVVGCVYASPTTYKTLTITESFLELTENGNITFNSNYTVKDVDYQAAGKTYEIHLTDGVTWTVTHSKNTLTTDYASIVYSVYERKE